MDDPRFVRPGERVGDLHGVAKGLTDPERPRRDDLLERPPLGVLHHDEVDAGIGADVVDGDDVRVVERARRLGFLDEAPLAVGIGDLVGGRTLMATVRFSEVSRAL